MMDQGAPLHVLRAFEHACLAHPDKLAVSEAGCALSYAELASRSSCLAGALRHRGIVRGDLVCIVGQRSIDFVVAVLAIWRCAAVYVPIADDAPTERQNQIIGECGARLVITTGSTDAMPGWFRLADFEYDAVTSSIALPEPDLRDVAYVIHTSGSTGVPKGVVVGHDSLAPIIDAYAHHFAISAADRVSSVASIGFDASIIECWPALTRGASVHIGAKDILHSVYGLTIWMKLERISFGWLPTPIVEVLVRDDGLRLPDCLRMLVTAGERLKCRPGAGWTIPLENAYGPTEGTVIATSSRVAHEGDTAPDIGRPLRGVSVYILDHQWHPVVPGQIGELFIGGIGVARGYLNQPELTTRRFVPDPFAGVAGARMYATGDLCRWNASGCIEFIGRADGQVKIRGHRVELGEIEQVMIALPGIRQAACHLVGQQLVGCYVRDQAGVAIDALADALRRRLPTYMVPDAFVELAELPLNARGKLDRNALPAPAPAPIADTAASDVLTAEQHVFLGWYREASGIEFGWNDDFFLSGGNSVSAIVLLESLRRRYGVWIGLADLFAGSSPAALHAQVRQGGSTCPIDAVEIVPRPPAYQQRAPLSSSQRSIWFVAGLDPEDRAYHAKALVVFEGDMCAETLRRALTDVVARHEIFRTAFELDGDAPVQRIEPPFEVELPRIDLTAASERQARALLPELLQGSINRPFDLGRAPLARWALVSLPGRASALLHVEHHLVHDGWSYNLFLEDLFACYREHAGLSPVARTRARQYADYCLTQRDWLDSEGAAVAESYWRRTLTDAPLRINLPSNGTANAASGRTVRVQFQRRLWQRLEAYCRQHGGTPFSFVLGAYSYLLSSYSGDADLCIGSAFANRSWGGADRVIGMVINTVVLRVGLQRDDRVGDHLRRCLRTCIDAQAHQAYPFERLVQQMNPIRLSGENPLFQVFLGFHDSPIPEAELPGIDRVRITEALDSGSAKFDLSLVVIPRGGQDGDGDPVHMLWEYRPTRLAPWFVEQLIAGFERVVEQFLAGAECALFDVAAGPASALSTPAPANAALRTPYQRIRRMAEQHPDRTAIRAGSRTLTYHELLASIETGAAALAADGVSRGGRVALCMRRTIDLVPWLLAIQHAGAAYVPIDPTYPQARIDHVLEHCAPRRVLQDAHANAVHVAPLAMPTLERQDPAYVIYTSGSTGRPKGVVLDHGNLSAFLDAMIEIFPLGGDDRWCAVTSISFDISILEFLLPLCSGATLVLADDDTIRDAGRLVGLLNAEAITHLQATPSTWRTLLDTGWTPSCPRFVGLCGGETLPPLLAADLLTRGIELYNLYGPTETTIWSCLYPLRDASATVPIGKPIAGTHVHILDHEMRPLPLGAVGELWIGGAGVGQGYLHAPEQSMERFIRVPALADGRLYRTGDIASIDAVGNLHFHGRQDGQVKIRGYRVELAEVERTLEATQGVSQCAVVAVPQHDTLMLAAYVVPNRDGDVERLRACCADTLPAYMIPDLWIALDALPLTPNGKIDRASLPAPSVALVAATSVPRTPIEADLVKLYADLLVVEQVDPTRGFYSMGGHSLLAMRLVARINRTYAIDLSVTEFLRLDSIRAVAQRIEIMCGEAPLFEVMI